MADLLEQFVTVRAVQMWGVDLSKYQFDGNLTWSAIFLNGDGTIYGRYGTRAGRDAMETMSVDGLIAALRGALELHEQYPANKSVLQGKAGTPRPWGTGETLPAHEGRFTEGDTSRMGCVHCHFVDEGIVKSTWLSEQPVPDSLLWSFPMPNSLGFSLDPKARATVTTVSPDSVAARGGLQQGDRIMAMDNQPILSIADVQWVLHQAEDEDTVRVEVGRGAESLALKFEVSGDWRRHGGLTWRGGIYGLRPAINTEELTDDERTALGLAADRLALRIRGTQDQWGRVAGRGFDVVALQRDDVLVAINDDTTRRSDSDFIAWFWQNTRPGESVTLTVLRAGEKVDLTVKTP